MAAAGNVGGGLCFLPIFVIWATLLVHWLVFYYKKVPEALQRWAEEGGYRILLEEQRSFFKGPFFWNSGKMQVVYRMHVRDKAGRERWGWVRIGRYWWPIADQIDVIWDPPRPEPIPEDRLPTPGNPLMWDRDLDT